MTKGKMRLRYLRYAIQLVFWTILLLFCVRPSILLDGKNCVVDSLRGMKSHSVIVAGRRVHYLVAGPVDGPPVVLVHGLGGDAEDWRNLAAPLTRAGYRVYIPELIGYGRSEKPADFSYTVQNETDIVVGFMDALGLKKVDLGGWSMGGWIVQLVASEHPERVKRLILFDSGGLKVKPDWDTRLFTPATPDELKQFFALLVPHPPKLPAVAGWIVLHVRKDEDWVIRRAVASMLTGGDTTDDRLPGLKMPVLIVWGEVDRVFPLVQGETMHHLVPQSQLEVIPGCGHMAPVQCSAQIAPKLVDFLSR
jgi:pimeloyl-ACP methyl ester carboxylesterase